ncbi:hypothetical protein [Sinomonas albida]|uniref:hypothetical protein n=2 Tax=Sinomonas albida TaxID=369942 RepID=UPI003016683F
MMTNPTEFAGPIASILGIDPTAVSGILTNLGASLSATFATLVALVTNLLNGVLGAVPGGTVPGLPGVG